MSLKPSTRQLISDNNKRSTKIWHGSVRKGRTVMQSLKTNISRRKKAANGLRQRMKKGC